jgi:hypothetical protein
MHDKKKKPAFENCLPPPKIIKNNTTALGISIAC